MILIFHLSKYFFLNYKLLLRSTTLEDFPGSCLVSQKTQMIFRGYIRKNELCFFVWSQEADCNFTRLLG